MNKDISKEKSKTKVAELIRTFRLNETDYLKSNYNETQVRTDFINPLLEAFGWDVYNTKKLPLALREVVEESTVEVGEERLSKKPDYELRLARQRKLFIEAKKPNINIDRDRSAAFQTRRYGYSASLPIAILTSFNQMAVYDCIPVPNEKDEAHVARLMLISYDEFENRFDELWAIFSRSTIYSGAFDKKYSVGLTRHGAQQFDDYFLTQVKSWRERLAVDIHANTPGLSSSELTYAVQLFLSRIIFLRICEDRDIEKYETLKNLSNSNTFAELMNILKKADKFYDSGLFRLLDDSRLNICISNETLKKIILELYYPQSPYTFAVVETEVLGEIYELFLGEAISVINGEVKIVTKPEVRESGGVVPTPRYLVDSIVERTLAPLISQKSPSELIDITIADICCGSGIFLLSAYEHLLNHYLEWYLTHNKSVHTGRVIYESVAGQWRLTFGEKRRILFSHLRGVDIDANAVEVARFSLLLKLIDGESSVGLREFVDRNKTPALPPLDNNFRSGNSLISVNEWKEVFSKFSDSKKEKINPFNWHDEFLDEMQRGGFDIILGNPPYIRIQNMTVYSPEEVTYYKNAHSPYTTAHQDNFDKYALFIERALSLLNPHGRLGMIVPHKFMSINAGKALRHLISRDSILEQIIHFGSKQVFGSNISNYTCILVLNRKGCDVAQLEQVDSLEEWRYGQPGKISTIELTKITENAWEFSDSDVRPIFERIRTSFPSQLGNISEIFVGVQTSADDIYILHATEEDETTVSCQWNNKTWLIEKAILRPCLHDVTLYPYVQPRPNAWIIFPYELRKNRTGRIIASLIQPNDFSNRFPRCWAYLKAHKAELGKRNITGGTLAERQWYQYGRSQSLTKFDTPKIILPILSTESRYTYDTANTIVTGGGNGPYYMIRSRPNSDVSDLYLLAVFNHPLCEAMIRTNTSLFRGGYYSHGKQFIENLPIPIASKKKRESIEKLVNTLMDELKGLESARIPHEITQKERSIEELKNQIEKQVSNIFQLSSDDLDFIRKVPIPS